MPRKRDAIAKALTDKGFSVESSKRDHDFFFFEHSGKRLPLGTKLSRGTGYKEIGDSLLGPIAKQLKLSKAQLLQLVDCPMTREKYVEVLRARLIILPSPDDEDDKEGSARSSR